MHDDDLTRVREQEVLVRRKSAKSGQQQSVHQGVSGESPKNLETGDWASTSRLQDVGDTVWQPGIEQSSGTRIPVNLDSLSIPTLVVLNGFSEGKMLSLVEPKVRWTVGSDAEKDLLLVDDGVSRNHAIVENRAGEWWVYDELSKNKTFVNNQAYNSKLLNSGDLLGFGPIECLLVLPTSGMHDRTTWRATWQGLSRGDRIVLAGVFIIGMLAGAVLNSLLT